MLTIFGLISGRFCRIVHSGSSTYRLWLSALDWNVAVYKLFLVIYSKFRSLYTVTI